MVTFVVTFVLTFRGDVGGAPVCYLAPCVLDEQAVADQIGTRREDAMDAQEPLRCDTAARRQVWVRLWVHPQHRPKPTHRALRQARSPRATIFPSAVPAPNPTMPQVPLRNDRTPVDGAISESLGAPSSSSSPRSSRSRPSQLALDRRLPGAAWVRPWPSTQTALTARPRPPRN